MPEAILVVQGFLALYGAYIAVAVTVASYVASSRQARRTRLRAQEAARLAIKDRTVTVRSAIFPHQYIFGRAKISGAILFADSTSVGSPNNVLDLVIGLTGHQLDGIEKYYFGTDEITVVPGVGTVTSPRYYVTHAESFVGTGTIASGQVTVTPPAGYTLTAVYACGIADPDPSLPNTPVNFTVAGNVISVNPTYNGQTLAYDYTATFSNLSYAYVIEHLGSPSQTADSVLTAAHPGIWTDQHRLRGRGYLVGRLVFNPDVWTSGIPDIAVLARGFLCFDPRTSTTAFTDNSAICIHQYLTSPYGLNCTTAELDEPSFISSANICDEWVTVDTSTTGINQARWTTLLTAGVAAGTWQLVSGTTYRQRRYTCNGVFDAGQAPLQVLSDMLSSCAGSLSYTGGKWRLTVGAYLAPTIPAITENDLRGPMEIIGGPGHAELFNAVRGTFVGPMNKFIETDYQPARNFSYETDDGELIYTDQPLPFTNDALAAQRIAKITLDRERQAIRVSLQLKLVGLQLRPGDVFPLTLARPGWVNKPFRVEKWSFTTDSDLGVNITAQEEASTSYDWNLGAATLIDSEPNTTLPSPWIVPAVIGLTIESGTAQLLKLADGGILTRAKFSWTKPADTTLTELNIEYKRAASGEVDYSALPPERPESGFSYATGFQDNQTYLFRARFTNSHGVSGQWVYAYTTILGKSQPPPDLLLFTVQVLVGGTRRFTFTAPTGVIDGDSIRIRYIAGASSNWAAMAEFHAPILYNQFTSTYYFESVLPANGTWSFGVKLYDTSGNESLNPLIISGAALSSSPVSYSVVENMLRNCDWTQDVGNSGVFLPDARALRSWAAAKQTPSYMFLRNYNGGSAWNIGLGGCCIYDPNDVVDGYAYLYQNVPAGPTTEYEASVYVSIHRCNVIMYLRFLDAGGNMISGGDNSDGKNSGSAVIGLQTDRSQDWRLWVKGTAPAGTVSAQMILLCQATAVSTPYPFTAWSKSMINVAPAGVTRETATPWVTSQDDTVDGQLVTVGNLAWASDHNVVFGATAVKSITFTPTTNGVVTVSLTGEFRGDLADSGWHYGKCRYWARIAQGGVPVADAQKQLVSTFFSNAQMGTGWISYAPSQIVGWVAAGVSVTVSLTIDPDPATSGNAGDGYIFHSFNCDLRAIMDRKVQ